MSDDVTHLSDDDLLIRIEQGITALHPGTYILVRFPEPHAPQKRDEHWYPGVVIRAYVRHNAEDLAEPLVYLSAAVFVDYYADPPKPPGGVYAGATGPVLTCMDLRPYGKEAPEKGGWWTPDPELGMLDPPP